MFKIGPVIHAISAFKSINTLFIFIIFIKMLIKHSLPGIKVFLNVHELCFRKVKKNPCIIFLDINITSIFICILVFLLRPTPIYFCSHVICSSVPHFNAPINNLILYLIYIWFGLKYFCSYLLQFFCYMANVGWRLAVLEPTPNIANICFKASLRLTCYA